ncbi:MAG: hypothetical protein P3B98_13800, partial [Gemmatimonadota bacterium]|nr:hypothetical protein [Gemmatimonadota bacterium]
MDARERLRVYLEQRREMGESEFMLDSLPVEDVLRLIGDRSPAAPAREPSGGARTGSAPATRGNAAPEAGPVERTAPATTATNWRDALTSIGADAPGRPSTAAPVAAAPVAAASVPPVSGPPVSVAPAPGPPAPRGFAADAE